MMTWTPGATAPRPLREQYALPAPGPSSRGAVSTGFDALLERAVEIPTDGRHGAGAGTDEDARRAGFGAGAELGRDGDSRRHQQEITSGDDVATVRNNTVIQSISAASARDGASLDDSLAGAIGLPPEELKKLVRVLRSSAVSGRHGVSLTLSLGTLGEVSFDVRLDGSEVHIRATVGDQRAAAALAISLGELEQRLAECDLSLAGFGISIGGAPPRGGADEGKGVAVRVTAMRGR